jgi:hypothetical protein
MAQPKKSTRRRRKPAHLSLEPLIKGCIAWVGTLAVVGGLGVIANGIRSL